MNAWQVIVSNIGTVYDGAERKAPLVTAEESRP